MRDCVIGLAITTYKHDPQRLEQNVCKSSVAAPWCIFLYNHNPTLENDIKSFAATSNVQIYLYCKI